MNDIVERLLADYNLTARQLRDSWPTYMGPAGGTFCDIYVTDQRLFIHKGTKIYFSADIVLSVHKGAAPIETITVVVHDIQ